jgi:phosphate uptake regulator
MDTQKNIQVLRLHLLDMSKLSQRAVDYAIKGYKLGSPEFCRYVRQGDRQLFELRHAITDLCQSLLLQELTADSEVIVDEFAVGPEVRFLLSALQICGALHATCVAAAEIARHTMLLLEDVRLPGSAALEKVCHLVNRLMCLCIIALFKKESQHAETVLENQEVGRLFEQAFHDLRSDISRQIAIPTAPEVAITNGLRQIARQVYEVAEAIVFWLEGRRYAVESGAGALA